jgi:flagellar motor switch protein FliN
MDTKLGELQRELVTGLASELATVVGALLGGTATASPGGGPVTPGWVVNCGVSGPMTGRLTIAVGDEHAATLARRLMGMSEAPPDDAVADTIAEVAGQAAGGLGQQPVAGGAKIRVEGAPGHGVPAPAEPPAVFEIRVDDDTAFHFACWAQVEPAAEAVAAVEAPAPAAAPVSPAPPPRLPAVAAPENLDIILDIELPLTVRFGRTEMNLQALTRVGPGSVIDLDRSPDEPVEVLINEKVIARGEVVVVAGNYGVRITEVVSAADRIRTMGN